MVVRNAVGSNNNGSNVASPNSTTTATSSTTAAANSNSTVATSLMSRFNITISPRVWLVVGILVGSIMSQDLHSRLISLMEHDLMPPKDSVLAMLEIPHVLDVTKVRANREMRRRTKQEEDSNNNFLDNSKQAFMTASVSNTIVKKKQQQKKKIADTKTQLRKASVPKKHAVSKQKKANHNIMLEIQRKQSARKKRRASIVQPKLRSHKQRLTTNTQQLVGDTDDAFPPEELLELDLSRFHSFLPVYFHMSALERDKNLLQSSSSKSKLGIQPLHQQLLDAANRALTMGPWSVVHKLPDPVLGNWSNTERTPHDYYNPAPYYWPSRNNSTATFQKRPSQRIPGTSRTDDQTLKDRYDQSRLAAMQTETTVLALAYSMTRDAKYAYKAVENIQTWFLSTETRMNPNLQFAQIRGDDKQGFKTGILDMKDVYYLLDAIRILSNGSFLTSREQYQLKRWFLDYMNWLDTSRQGRLARQSSDHHGLYYDIQMISIAAFVNDKQALRHHLNWSLDRLASTSVESIMHNKSCEHYQIMALQGWSILARMASSITTNVELWEYYLDHRRQSLLCRIAATTIPYFSNRAVCNNNGQDKLPNPQRWWPLIQDARSHCPSLQSTKISIPHWIQQQQREQQNTTFLSIPASSYAMRPNHLDGVAPFWNFGNPNEERIWRVNERHATIPRKTTILSTKTKR